jgi:hypothetical protein
VFPNTEYKGKVFFIWPQGRQVTAQALDFTLVDRGTTGFDLSPEKSDVMIGLGRPDIITVRVKNTGNTNISTLSISSLDLADGITKHRASWPTIVKNDLAIDPETDAVINVDLPKPILAGTYSGSARSSGQRSAT